MLWITDLVLICICLVLVHRLRRAYMERAHWKDEARTYLERYNAMIRAEKDTHEYRMQLYEKLSEENRQLKEQAEKDFSGLMNFSQECARHRERAAKAEAIAAAFEAAGKKKDEQLAIAEEHVAAERGRADRLAEALQKSEDKVERLQAELESVGDDKRKIQLQLLSAMRDVLRGTVLDKTKRRGEEPAFKSAINEQELANIMAYNGTAEGQVDLNDE